MLGTLMRAGDVLDLFTVEEPEWGVTATARRLGIGKSLAHEALATLAEIGLLRRVGHGRYRLGWRTVSLAAMLLRTNALSSHARSVVRDLAESHGVGVSLVAWERGQVICINRHEGRGAGAPNGMAAGSTMPPDDSAAARVLLASRPAAEIEGLWSAGSVRTRHQSLKALRSDLAEVAHIGWALDNPAGVARLSVAAPVRDIDGGVAAAISLAAQGVGNGLDAYRHARLAVAAAARISEAMRAAA